MIIIGVKWATCFFVSGVSIGGGNGFLGSVVVVFCISTGPWMVEVLYLYSYGIRSMYANMPYMWIRWDVKNMSGKLDHINSCIYMYIIIYPEKSRSNIPKYLIETTATSYPVSVNTPLLTKRTQNFRTITSHCFIARITYIMEIQSVEVSDWIVVLGFRH